MELTDVGHVIAETELETDDDRKILVVVGQPQRSPDGDDFYCPYKISGVGREKVRCGFGVDSLQALVLTLQVIEVHLDTSAGKRAGALTWLGGSKILATTGQANDQ